MRLIKKSKLINGVRNWQCSKCLRWFCKKYFYKDSRMSNGLKSQCIQCHINGSIATRNEINKRKLNREYMRRAKKLNPEKFRKREREQSKKARGTLKQDARMMVNLAVKRGTLIKPKKCSKCNKERKLQGHHENYMKPLDVEWLCSLCHGEKSWK